jgi:hypothetical protein
VAGQDNQRSPWNKKADHVCLPGDFDSAWEEATAAAEFPGRSDMGCVVFDGKVVIAGGQGGSKSSFALLNDVWSSKDAVSWTSLTLKAEWAGRKNFGMIVYNKKIWVLGGLHIAGSNGKLVPTNSIWSSTDGVKWLQVKRDTAYCVGNACAGVQSGASGPVQGAGSSTTTLQSSSSAGSTGTGGYMWAPRHSFVTFDFLGKLYVISGLQSSESAENAATTDFRHDVWSSQDGVSWEQVAPETPWAGTATRHGRRAVAGAVHQLTMYVLAEAEDYKFYYNIWSSRDGVSWQEPSVACVISGQPIGSAIVIGSGMHARAYTHTRTNAHTRAHTHTHTHVCTRC